MAYSLVTNGTVPGGTNGGTSSGLNTTGATLLIFITDQYVGGPALTVSDSNSNTWVGRTSKTSGEPQVRIWEAKNPTVGTGHTFSTVGSGVYASGVILAFSGADTTAPFDVENGGTAASGTTIQSGTGVTPGQANSLIVTGIGTGPGSTISSIDSSYTITNTINYSTGVNEGVSGAYLIQGSAGLSNPTWTISNPNVQGFAAVIAAYKPSTGAGAQNLAPSLFTNSNTFFAATVAAGAVNLAPSLFTNSSTFFSPTVTSVANLAPALFTNNSTFFSPTVVAAGNLAPSLFTNSSTFFSPTVGRGAVNLAPTLFANSNIFYSPTVAVAQPQTLLPALYTNPNTFFLPVVHSRIVLVNVNVKLKAPHVFSATEYPTDTIFGPDQSTVPADFQYTPLMEGLSPDSIAAIAQTSIDVFGRYDSHGNLLDNPPIPRPIYDPQPTPAVGNKHFLPIGNGTWP